MEGWFLVVSDFGQLLFYLMGAVLLPALYTAVRQTVGYLLTENKALQQLETNLLYRNTATTTADTDFTQLTEDLTHKCEQGSAVWRRVKTMYYLAAQNRPVALTQIQDADAKQEQASFTYLLQQHAVSFLLGLGALGWLYGITRFAVVFWQAVQQTGAASVMELLKTAPAANALGYAAEGFVLLFGAMVGVVLFILLTLPHRWAKKQFENQLEQVSANRLLPLFNPVLPNEQLGNLANTVAQNTAEVTAAIASLTDVTAQISAGYDNLSRFTDNLRASTDAFIALQDAFAEAVAQLQQTHPALPAPAAQNETYKLAEALNLHNATIAQLTDRLYKNEFDFSDWLKDIISLTQKQHQEFKDELKGLLEMVRSNLSNTTSATNRFDISTKKFKDSLDAMELLLNSFANMVQEAVQKEVMKLDELNLKLQNLQQHVQALHTDIPAHLTRMNTTLDNTNKLANPQYLEQMAHTIAADAIQKEISVYAQEYKRLEEQIALLEERLARKQQSGWIDKIAAIFTRKRAS
ncbi:MAG TPA: hypothetical protein PK239_10855 [Chitinophagales bacterium]|nr:hypothetical protein [Chitinophagales bacterium]HRK27766.1 hypothetical protein [Chitinophagales bacterium]